jgi:hypothetical protein
MRLNLPVCYGSVRSAHQGTRVARFVAGQCRWRGHEVHLIDPRASLRFDCPVRRGTGVQFALAWLSRLGGIRSLDVATRTAAAITRTFQ